MNRDNEFDTTVLTAGYDDFQDTVVDQVVAFDPALFQNAPAPTVGAATSSTVRNPEEDTWVLGSQPARPVARSSAGSAPVEPAAAPAAGFMPTSTAGVGAQQPSSTWQAAPRATPVMMAAADSSPGRANPLFIGVIIGLAIVGVVAIVVAIAFALAPQESSSSAPSSAPAVAVVPTGSSSSGSDEAVSPELESEPEPEPEAEKSTGSAYKQGAGSSRIVSEGDGRALSEADLYRLLSEYYSLAGDYDAAIRGCATDFNENFLKEDKSARNSKASQASSLKTKVKSSWDDLKRAELPFMSKNTQAYRDLCECYECLWHRIDVIDQAWKIDLQYDKPKEHEDEIIAPLRAQQANGNDKYYTRFKELYPNVTLVKP